MFTCVYICKFFCFVLWGEGGRGLYCHPTLFCFCMCYFYTSVFISNHRTFFDFFFFFFFFCLLTLCLADGDCNTPMDEVAGSAADITGSLI